MPIWVKKTGYTEQHTRTHTLDNPFSTPFTVPKTFHVSLFSLSNVLHVTTSIKNVCARVSQVRGNTDEISWTAARMRVIRVNSGCILISLRPPWL